MGVVILVISIYPRRVPKMASEDLIERVLALEQIGIVFY